MKAIVIDEIGSFSLREVGIPGPAEGEALIKVSVTGLCRTDLKIIRTGHRDLTLPRIPGEEVVGTISRLGSGMHKFAEGQRVYLYPGTSCGACPQCIGRAENLCRSMRIMGFHRDGGFAEYVIAPVKSLIPVPDSISDDEAVFTEPLSCCLNALELARPLRGEHIGIWGGGPAGTLLKRASEALGCRPMVVERDERRRALINGHTAPPEEVNVAVVAVGDAEAYREALQCLSPRGRLVVFSGLPKDGASLPVDFNSLHYHEHTITGAYGCSYHHGKLAMDMIRTGQVRVRDMISHRMALEELDAALGIVERREGMKILLYP